MEVKEDFVTRKIAKDIQKTCEEAGEIVSMDLVALTMNYVFHNPKFGFNPAEPLDDAQVDRLMTLTRDRILHDDHGAVINTIKMQTRFKLLYKSRENVSRDQRWPQEGDGGGYPLCKL